GRARERARDGLIEAFPAQARDEPSQHRLAHSGDPVRIKGQVDDRASHDQYATRHVMWLPSPGVKCKRLEKNPGNTSTYEGCESASQHAFQAEFSDDLAPVGEDGAEAADLHGDGREVREAAEEVGREHGRARVERG